MTPTIKDVAQRAGVSTATASRALSSAESETVRPATRARVAQAALELGYTRSSLPAQMRKGRSDVFGLVMGDVENPFYTAVVKGFEKEAHRLGFRVILVNTDEDSGKEAAALEALAAERVAGVALAAASDVPAGVSTLTSLSIPLVTFDNRVSSARLDSVTVDNKSAARRAMEYLVKLGHSRVGMVSGPLSASSVKDRQTGWAEALGFDRSQIATMSRQGTLRAESAYACASELLAAERPTAIFSVNNVSTVGVIRAAREHDIEIPHDLSLIGFDDFPLAELFTPALTVVSQPTDDIGRTSAQLLHRRLQEPDAPPRPVVLRTAFIERASCAPPLASRPRRNTR